MAGGSRRRSAMARARYFSAGTAHNRYGAPGCGALQKRISQHDRMRSARARRSSQRDQRGGRVRRVACRQASRSCGAAGRVMMRLVAGISSGFVVLMALVLRSDGPPAQVPAAQIDSLFTKLVSSRDPGCAVLVVKDGKAVFRKGYGVTDLRTFETIGPETNFRLASLTKQFTAMAVMLLVHDGKLRYDDRLTDIFSDFPAYGNT